MVSIPISSKIARQDRGRKKIESIFTCKSYQYNREDRF